MKLSEDGLENVSNLSDVDLEYEEFEACDFTGELTMSWMGFKTQKHGMDIIVGSSYSDLKVKIHNVPFDAVKRFAFELSMAVIKAEERIEQAEKKK